MRFWLRANPLRRFLPRVHIQKFPCHFCCLCLRLCNAITSTTQFSSISCSCPFFLPLSITLYWSLARHHVHFAVHLQSPHSSKPSSLSSISFSSHGWGAIGWSSSPSMSPSDAVIWDLPRGNQLLAGGKGGLVAVLISGHSKSAIEPARRMELRRVSITHSDNTRTIVR